MKSDMNLNHYNWRWLVAGDMILPSHFFKHLDGSISMLHNSNYGFPASSGNGGGDGEKLGYGYIEITGKKTEVSP